MEFINMYFGFKIFFGTIGFVVFILFMLLSSYIHNKRHKKISKEIDKLINNKWKRRN